MTTKLYDAHARTPLTPNELPPDPMLLYGLQTATGNYLIRVQDAVASAADSAGLVDAGALARAAVAFQSEIRLIALGQDVDPQQGPTYDPGNPITLDQSDADIQQVTNALLSLTQNLNEKLSGPLSSGDLMRGYILARGSVNRVLDSILTFW